MLLVTISPHQLNFSETLSTLRFAKRAKQIKNKRTCTPVVISRPAAISFCLSRIPAIVNEIESIDQLKATIEQLRSQLEKAEGRVSASSSLSYVRTANGIDGTLLIAILKFAGQRSGKHSELFRCGNQCLLYGVRAFWPTAHPVVVMIDVRLI